MSSRAANEAASLRGVNMLLRLLTIQLAYRIANALWEPRMSPVFCGIKGNDLLLIITPQSRSGRMPAGTAFAKHKTGAQLKRVRF